MKRIIPYALFLLCCYSAAAQQQVMFTQYMFNQLPMNPAYAGIHQGISAGVISRHQWVGVEGAPQTQTFSIHSPVKYQPIAVGGVFIKDQIGLIDQLGAHFSFSYRIEVTEHSKLSFGLQGSFNQYRADYSESAAINPDLAAKTINNISGNVGSGVMWHSEKFYLGVSIPQMINNPITDGVSNPIRFSNSKDTDPDSEFVRHYFATGGYVIELNKELKLKPNVLIKWVENSPVQFDLNANMLIKEIVWVGMSYRALESVDALLQIQLNERLQFGYAYDIPANSEMGRVNNGSHEIMLNYVFNLRSGNVASPRYF